MKKYPNKMVSNEQIQDREFVRPDQSLTFSHTVTGKERGLVAGGKFVSIKSQRTPHRTLL